MQGFKKTWGLPQCAAALNRSHIPIVTPTDNHTDYYNHKGWYSVVIQGVVDYQYQFTDVYVGRPGSVHDARILAHSTLFKKTLEATLLPATTKCINGTDVPLHLVGDSAYPLTTWLMNPFPHKGQFSSQQRHFTYRLPRPQIVVENGFGRLKAHWCRLLKRLDMSIENILIVIAACCVLHNLCEIHREVFLESWITESDPERNQPQHILAEDVTSSDGPEELRSSLVQYSSHYPL